MPYCENCGKPVNPNAKFCANCGSPLISQLVAQVQPEAPIYAPPPPPPPPVEVPVAQPTPASTVPPTTQASSEPVIGAIVFKKSKSLGRWDTYTGVVTGQRLIFAQMTSEMLKVAAQQARDRAKADGKGFFGQWGDQLKATMGYANRYLSMQPQAILAETPGNFEISNSVITEIKVKEKWRREDQQIYEFDVQIHSATGKYEYVMDQNSDYVKLLKQAYGDRVKMPLGYFSKSINIKL